MLLLLAGCVGREGGQDKSVEENGGGNAVSKAQSGVAAGDSRPVEAVAAKPGPSVVQVNVEAVQRTPRGPRWGEAWGVA